jgi:hypothetical protein
MRSVQQALMENKIRNSDDEADASKIVESPNVDDQHRRAAAGAQRRSAATDGEVWNKPSTDR